MALTSGPLVSIITPVYNGAEYLDELIRSVQDQDYSRIEHLIIDDGSDDKGATQAILQKYSHLRWWRQDNKGQYATMNEGMLAARGEILCFVSADDAIAPGAVSSVVDFLSRRPQCDGVFGIATRIDLQGRPIPYYIPFRTAPIYFYQYFAHISHCSLYVKKDSLKDHNLTFDPSLKYNGDYDWMIRIYRNGLKIGLLKRELSKVRLHTDQTSQKHFNASFAEAKRVISNHGISRPLYLIFNTLYKLLFKLWLVSRMLMHDENGVLFERWTNKYNNR